MNELLRADVALVLRGLAASREKAQNFISGGMVMHNGKQLLKASAKVSDTDELIVCGNDMPYVSRGGLKLEKAINVFDVETSGIVAMDIGASTGGFTDVLLQNGARKVYAIDVGFGQLDEKLRNDPRVISLEHTNARALESEMFDEQPQLGVMDVSFISIKLILPAAFKVLGEKGRMISLIKPQFEAGRSNIGKGGIVSKKSVHEDVLRSVLEFVPMLDWKVIGLDHSPISGGDGNIEFLADMVHASNEGNAYDTALIPELVRRAHNAMKSK